MISLKINSDYQFPSFITINNFAPNKDFAKVYVLVYRGLCQWSACLRWNMRYVMCAENKPLLDTVSGQMSVSVVQKVPVRNAHSENGLLWCILSRALSWEEMNIVMSGLVWWRRTAYCLAQVCERLRLYPEGLDSVCWQHLMLIANI